MKLLYFRLEERLVSNIPKALSCKDINFSDEYNIKLINDRLEIKENCLKNFYDFRNIEYIKVIIGKNGSGKSMLLSLIYFYLQFNSRINTKIKFVLCLKQDEEIFAVVNGIDITCDNKKVKILNLNDFIMNEQFQKNFAVIYASNSFSWDDYFSQLKNTNYFYNISFDHYIREEKKTYKWSNNLYHKDYVDDRFSRSYMDERKNKQKIKNIKFVQQSSFFNVPNISISLDFLFNRNTQYSSDNLRMYKKQLKIGKLEKKIYKIAEFEMNKKQKSEKEIAKLSFYIRIVDMLFDEITNKINISNIEDHLIKKIDKEKNLKCTSINELLQENYKFIKENKKFIKKRFSRGHQKEELEYYCEIYINDLIDDLHKIIQKYEKIMNKIDDIIELSVVKIRESGIYYANQNFYNYIPYLIIPKKHYSEIIDFFDDYNKYFSKNIFEISYNETSAGINARISLYSNIQETLEGIKKIKNAPKDVIFLLDEPDLYFHPEWKRKFLKEFTSFLEKNYDFSFQLVITTNEPYMLSDLNRNSIISLNEDYNQNSRIFAANIYELLKNQYFMDEYIGEISKKLINNNIKKIKECNDISNKKNLMNFIDEIGDSVIRNKLSEMLEMYYDSNTKI